MKIVIVHNAYQHAGGEDAVVRAEVDLLRQEGHKVSEYLRHNDEIRPGGVLSRMALGCKTVWSSASRKQLSRLLRDQKPDLVHFHNTFPLISPAAYYSCRDLGIPVVQTLHNFRLLCPAATFFRDGKVCEECLHRSRWQAVRHACYRDSRSATCAVTAMIQIHGWLNTWNELVSSYVVLSEYSRQKFLAGGLPARKMTVKPNFVLPDPGVGARGNKQEFAIFVGRISEEKGIRTLLQAWKGVRTGVLVILGDGPLRAELTEETRRMGIANVQWEGRLPQASVFELVQRARVLVVPSECYENFPMTIAEAYACGTPVIASRLGAMQELVHDGETGLQFTPGDSDDLASKLEWAFSRPDKMSEMGRRARSEYEAKYTAKHNYMALLNIYGQAIEEPSNQVQDAPRVLNVAT